MLQPDALVLERKGLVLLAWLPLELPVLIPLSLQLVSSPLLSLQLASWQRLSLLPASSPLLLF